MDQKIFDFVVEKFGAAVEETGYRKLKEPEENKDGPAAVFLNADAAYEILYHTEKKRFELRSCVVEDEKPDGKWKPVSAWLFDPETDTQNDAQSIVSDFIETVRGPRQLAAAKKRKKHKKDDENNVDALFFFNRFVGVFPELKEEITAERAAYGDVRAVTFARANLLPKLEDLLRNRSFEKSRVTKCCSLFNDMYISGDMDVRSVITIVILNGLSREAVEIIRPQFSEELAKGFKAAQKIRDKKFKPEKKKKHKSFMARTLENMDQQ